MLTDRIVKNMKTMDDSGWREESIKEFDGISGSIVANLEIINEDQNALDILEEQTSRIAGNLEAINTHENNLDLLEEQTTTIVRNLELINKASAGQ
jgi:hypothetical protein